MASCILHYSKTTINNWFTHNEVCKIAHASISYCYYKTYKTLTFPYARLFTVNLLKTHRNVDCIWLSISTVMIPRQSCLLGYTLWYCLHANLHSWGIHLWIPLKSLVKWLWGFYEWSVILLRYVHKRTRWILLIKSYFWYSLTVSKIDTYYCLSTGFLWWSNFLK